MYDVIIIGAGHAGLEAAYIASGISQKVLLLTLKLENIGEMSCNPAIGGIGKGTIVREVDALGGIMGQIIDVASIHSKMLNESKGPAVWGPRAQADRSLYKQNARRILNEMSNLEIKVGECVDVVLENDCISGIILADGSKILCKSLVITTGTFLSGQILIGSKRINAGRVNENPSYGLSSFFDTHNFDKSRLKTGTPPRILASSINYDILEKQYGDATPQPFSYLTEKINVKQIPCFMTETNERSHEILFQNKEKSPIYTKEIHSRGPRYCPSIEDKTLRFAEKTSHRIFLEPEGLTSNLIYPNGISTAMAEEVQTEFIHSIKGLENAKIEQFGYAIEYDFINPQELTATLETKRIKGLFLAGQINGTTGYEEAAGQGIIAGINAARSANDQDAFTLGRHESYIGVMIDDLITKGVTEPYRMFTSRCEYRISIRADNADIRLTPFAIMLGTACKTRTNSFKEKLTNIAHYRQILESKNFSPNELSTFGIELSHDGVCRNGIELLAHQKADIDTILKIFHLANANKKEMEQIIIDAKYSVYLKRQADDIAVLLKDQSINIPENLDYSSIKALSKEVMEKLSRIRPQNLGQALSIEGVTPAAIMAIAMVINSTRQILE